MPSSRRQEVEVVVVVVGTVEPRPWSHTIQITTAVPARFLRDNAGF